MPTREDYVAWLRMLSDMILKSCDLVSLPFVVSVKTTPTVVWFTYTLVAKELTVRNIYRTTYESDISAFDCRLNFVTGATKTKLTEIPDDLIDVLADEIVVINFNKPSTFYGTDKFEKHVPDEMLAIYRQVAFYASELPSVWNGKCWTSLS